MKNITRLDYLKRKKALIFDMDGTLFQSEPLHAKALRQTLLTKGVDISEKELEERFVGVADTLVFAELLPSESMDKLIELKNELLIREIKALNSEEAKALYTEGIVELLESFKGSETKLAVVSASETEIVNMMIEYSGLKEYFHLTMGRNDTAKTKPDPEPYLIAMNKLGVTPDETLIFEDSETGLQAATISKADTIRISNGKNSSNFSHLGSIANFSWLKK